MKRAIACLIFALALPSVAFAKTPHGHGTHGKASPKVMYVLKGTLSAYTAAGAGADGRISIDVTDSNFRGRALKGQSLTFTLTASSRVTVRHGSHAKGQIVDGTKGYITVRAPKKIAGALVTELPTQTTRIHVVVLKAPTP